MDEDNELAMYLKTIHSRLSDVTAEMVNHTVRVKRRTGGCGVTALYTGFSLLVRRYLALEPGLFYVRKIKFSICMVFVSDDVLVASHLAIRYRVQAEMVYTLFRSVIPALF